MTIDALSRKELTIFTLHTHNITGDYEVDTSDLVQARRIFGDAVQPDEFIPRKMRRLGKGEYSPLIWLLPNYDTIDLIYVVVIKTDVGRYPVVRTPSVTREVAKQIRDAYLKEGLITASYTRL